MSKKATLLLEEHRAALFKYIDERMGVAQFLLAQEIAKKPDMEWETTPIPLLAEYYAALFNFNAIMEAPYKSIERYEKLYEQVAKQNKVGIPVENEIFEEIKEYIIVIDRLKVELENQFHLPMEEH